MGEFTINERPDEESFEEQLLQAMLNANRKEEIKKIEKKIESGKNKRISLSNNRNAKRLLHSHSLMIFNGRFGFGDLVSGRKAYSMTEGSNAEYSTSRQKVKRSQANGFCSGSFFFRFLSFLHLLVCCFFMGVLLIVRRFIFYRFMASIRWHINLNGADWLNCLEQPSVMKFSVGVRIWCEICH